MTKQVDAKRSDPVAFRFRDIGPVKDARLELGDLTIIAGRNNTGKTYLVYTLYGFLEMWRSMPHALMLHHETEPEVGLPDWNHVAKQLAASGRYTFPLDNEALIRQRKWVIQYLTQSFSEQTLSEVFSSKHRIFEGSSIEINCNFEKLKLPRTFKTVLGRGRSLSVKYQRTEVVVTLD